MGFHIININQDNKLETFYAENIEELSKISSITPDSIIYQGEKHWTAVKMGDSPKYADFTKDWYRAGIIAQYIFREQAKQNRLILEELKQDQDSFKSYTHNSEFKKIKRGDFLIRNVRNLEIDVKCRGFKDKCAKEHFLFSVDDHEKHLNMMSFTQTPIIIAVYERINGQPEPDRLFMFEIEKLEREKENFEKVRLNNVGHCFRIPLGFTSKGFDLIHNYKNKLLPVNA